MNPKTLLDLFAIAAISFALNGGYTHRLLAQESSAPTEPSLSSPGQSDSHVGKPHVGKSQVGKFRFEPSATREYQIEQARKDSQARKELLRYYEERGVNFAQPTFDGMALHPYPVSKRRFYVRPLRTW